MEAFVSRALAKISEELKAGSSSKSTKKLIEGCDEALGTLKDSVNEQSASKYFGLLRQTCDSQNVAATTVALDCIQKLIAYGYLKGEEVISRPGKSGETEEVPLIEVIIDTICNCNDFADDGVQLQVIKALLTAITTDHCEVNEGSLLRAVRSCYNIHLVSHSIVNRTTAKATLTQVLSYVFQKMETTDIEQKKEASMEPSANKAAEEPETAANGGLKISPELALAEAGELADNDLDDATTEAGDSADWPSIDHKNAWLLFRALCKLSMKDSLNKSVKEASQNNQAEVPMAVYDPIAVQSKALSLELLLWVLKYSGPCFQTNPRFIHSVRSYLCVSLLRNCTSAVPEVVGHSLHVFVQLHAHFKHHLKGEVEVFITKIFLPLLDSENSTPYHKDLVLDVLYTMCADARTINDIFQNYDADFESTDLFQKMVNALARCAKGGYQMNPFDSYGVRRTSPLELKIRRTALEGLAAILKSLIASSKVKPTNDDTTTTPMNSSSSPFIQSEDGVVDEASVKRAIKNGDVLLLSPQKTLSGSISPADAVEAFDRKQKYQEEQLMGILQFNLKPSKGLAYLEDKGHFKHEPGDVAKFLHTYKNQLDKTVIGDYLGKEKQYQNGFCVKVLHEYIDQMNFTDMVFDEAIRHFLSGFRLPGEAQKIDRMMEKFAESFTLQNPDVFPSADTAFVLAFSIIMLNTDLHNPAIPDERRMTKKIFRRQAEGIASGGNLPEEMLDAIYDRIKANAISLKDDDDLRQKLTTEPESALGVVFGAVPAEKRRQQAFIQEREDMVKLSESLFQSQRKNKGRRGSIVDGGGNDDTLWVRPMFEVAWGPIVGTLSHTLESTANVDVNAGNGAPPAEDLDLVKLCLSTMCDAIHLAATLGIETARATLVNSLAKFTTLDSVREMKPRHVECIKALLKVAIDDGNYLGESWEPVLQCVSRLNRLHDAAQGSAQDDIFFSNGSKPSQQSQNQNNLSMMTLRTSSGASFSDGIAKMFGASPMAPPVLTQEAARALEESNAISLLEAVDSLSDKIDHIFENSTKLDSTGIVHFVTQLSAVAHLELHSGGTKSLRGWSQAQEDVADVAASSPRVFSLQKLVEVAAFNMDIRPRLIWSNVWGVLSKLFTSAGLHSNPKVAMYAIDSLRQLSVKFLTKDELRDFNFQRLFLRPFESIMRESKNADICELIVMTVDSIVQARLTQLRSGWKTMFAVLSLSTHGGMKRNQHVAELGFACLQRLTVEHFDILVLDFTELVNALLTFAASPDTPTAQVALALVQTCAEKLGSGAVAKSMSRDLKTGQRPTLNGREVAIDDNQWQLWWPLLYGVSQLVGDPRFCIREAAVDVLGSTLVTFGGSFSEETWRLVFKGVIFPIMESAWTDSTKEAQASSTCPSVNPPIPFSEASFITSTAHLVFKVCIDLLVAFPQVADTLLHETLSLLTESICQEIETLSRIAVRALHFLVMRMPPDAPPLLWDMLCEGLSVIACRPLPKQLSSPSTNNGASSSGESPQDAEQEVDQEPGIENLLIRRSIMTHLVVTLAIQEAIATVLEAFYLDLTTAQLRILLDAILSTATSANQFHNDIDIRLKLRVVGFMRFPNETLKDSSLPHLLEQETRAYGLLFDTLGRFLHFSDDSSLENNKDQNTLRLLSHSSEMQSANLNIGVMQGKPQSLISSERFWLPKVRAHGVLFKAKITTNQDEDTTPITRVFAYHLPEDEHVSCFGQSGEMEKILGEGRSQISSGDVLFVSWPGGCEVDVMSSNDFNMRYERVDRVETLTPKEEDKSIGEFAASRLNFIFQLVITEYAKKDLRCSKAQDDENESVDIIASYQNETAFLTPIVIQVTKALSQSSEAYLKANLSWVMPAMCELIRCNDEDVRIALHQIMTSKLCPILTVSLN